MNKIDGGIRRPICAEGTYDYRVWSDRNPNRLQPYEEFPTPGALGTYLQLPPEIRGRLRELAEKIVGSIPRDQPVARAEALESYLRATAGSATR